MKKLIFILLVLITLAFGNGQMRSIWMHEYYQDTQTRINDFIEKADSLNVNTIYLMTPILFSERDSNDMDNAIHDLDSAGFDIFIGWFWHSLYGDGFGNLSNEYDYYYRPINMTKTQFETAIDSKTNNQRGMTKELDKNNPTFLNLSVNEMAKYFDKYSELDGVVLDYIRMGGRIGSFHDSTIAFMEDNTTLDADTLIKIFSKLPIPSRQITANYGTSLVEGGIALATHGHDGGGAVGGSNLAITLQEHTNNGFCLTFHWKTGVFEMPIVNEIFEMYIDSIGYIGDTLYIWEYEDVDNSFSSDGIKYATEWAYTEDLIPKVIDDTSEVPDASPVVLGLPWKMDSAIAGQLKGHCETGGLVCLFRGAANTALYGLNQTYKELTGYNGNYLLKPISNNYPKGITIEITQDGIDRNIPHYTNRTTTQDTTYYNNWWSFNANTMLGNNGLNAIKEMLDEKYVDKKYIAISTQTDPTERIEQQQNWIYWLENGYYDIINQMAYSDNVSDFKDILTEVESLCDDFKTNYQPTIALNSSAIGIQDKDTAIAQIKYTLDSLSLSGYSLFAGDQAFDSYTVTYCDSIGDSTEYLNDNTPFAILDSSLVAYWKFSDSNWDTTTSGYFDLTGNGNYANPNFTPTYIIGQNGEDSAVANFNGSSDYYINCGNFNSFNIYDSTTFIIWALHSSLDTIDPDEDDVLFSKFEDADNYFYFQQETPNRSRFYSKTNSITSASYMPSSTGSYPSAFNSDVWNMYSFVYLVDSVKLYKNDSLVITKNTTSQKDSVCNIGDFIIGKRGGSSYYWDGAISQMKIFNKELSCSEIETEYLTTYTVPEVFDYTGNVNDIMPMSIVCDTLNTKFYNFNLVVDTTYLEYVGYNTNDCDVGTFRLHFINDSDPTLIKYSSYGINTVSGRDLGLINFRFLMKSTGTTYLHTDFDQVDSLIIKIEEQ